MSQVLIQVNAKLNLDFKILGRLDSGYHQIESLMQSIDISDFLLFARSGNQQITGAIICPESQNIISKAREILEGRVGEKLPCCIHLYKSIPIAAGLGGESADAAATLLGLNLLYELNLSQEELVTIGARIGADVPFFFYGGTCRIEGIGDKVTSVKQELPRFFVIFRPHQRIETKKMYGLYDESGENFLGLLRKIYPGIKELEEYLKGFNFQPKLSGSGPTLFCGLDDYDLAQKVAEGYPNFNGDIFICRSQDRALNIIKL